MAYNFIIRGATVVNEGSEFVADVLVKEGRIERIEPILGGRVAVQEINAEGLYLLPGLIDDQVHFREPGLTHKADIWHESKAAAAGGVTSFMEMPNTKPPALTRELLEQKYEIAAKNAWVNYSFYMGASNENADEVLRINYENVCGIKIFMGSSTGNMLVDDTQVLENLFRNAPVLIAVHCEDEHTIRSNMALALAEYGDDIPVHMHPIIRNRQACYLSSSLATALARKFNTRLHVLHISTADELPLFESNLSLGQKRITAEACVHHLFFDDRDYTTLGAKIKCNPAIKSESDRRALAQALEKGTIDVIATDHAPHTLDEKMQKYPQSPSGLPLVQHPLQMMLTLADEYHWSLPFIVQKMAHNVAECFRVKERGFIREGYYADLVLLDTRQDTTVNNNELLYKCQWSPLEGKRLKGKVIQTIVNGRPVFRNGIMEKPDAAMRLQFDRD